MSIIEKHLSDKLVLVDESKQSEETLTDQDFSATGQGASHRWASLQMGPLLRINSNWDGYGAREPSRVALEVATATLKMLALNGYMRPPEISPTRTGGIAMFWFEHSNTLEIEVSKNGSITLDTDIRPCSDTKLDVLSANSGDPHHFVVTFQAFFER